MICPECNGKGEAIYFVEIDRDENIVTVEKRKCICRTCNGSGEKPQTNADRIRAMSDEELVEHFWESMPDDKFCTGICNEDHDCDKCRLEWLKQPAEVDGNA